MFNIFLGVLLFLGPMAGYFLGGRTSQGLFIGLGLACLVMVIYLIIERVPLDMLVFGALGAFVGLICTKGIEWGIYKMDNPTAYSFFQDNSLLIYIFMAILVLAAFLISLLVL